MTNFKRLQDNNIRFSSDGKKLLGSADKTARIWDVESPLAEKQTDVADASSVNANSRDSSGSSSFS
jgi:WD40 repeat protein